MGIWPFTKKPKRAMALVPAKKRGRPTKAEQLERKKAELASMQTDIKLAEMRRRYDALLRGDDERPLDVPTLIKALQVAEQLKYVGGESTGVAGVIDRVLTQPGFGEVAGTLLAALMNGRTPQVQVSHPTPAAIAAPAAPAPAQTTPPTDPPPKRRKKPTAQQAPSAPAAAQELRAPAPLGLLSGKPAFAIGVTRQLGGQTPTEAAQLLVEAADQRDDVANLVQALCYCPDDRRAEELWPALVAAVPDAAAVVEWLAPQQAWVDALAAELRARTGLHPRGGGPAPSEGGAG